MFSRSAIKFCLNVYLRPNPTTKIWHSNCRSSYSKIPKSNFNKASTLKVIWNKLFGKYLLTTNIVSSGILMVAGDVILQEIEIQRNPHISLDYGRVFRMFVVGSLQGPLHHYFYKWMDDRMPLATASTVVKKILLDQFIMSPLCILLFFYPACLLENKSIKECNSELKAKFLTVYTVDWCIWPAAQYINFYYLHPKYRVIYVNLITMIYNVFLSYIKHKNIE